MWKRMLPSLIVPEYLETDGPERYAVFWWSECIRALTRTSGLQLIKANTVHTSWALKILKFIHYVAE